MVIFNRFIFGRSNENLWPTTELSISLHGSYGFIFSNMALSLATGIDVYNYGRPGMIPLYVFFSGDVSARRTSFLYYAGVGYGFPVYLDTRIPGFRRYRTHTGGIFARAGIGMKIRTGSKTSWLISVGPHLQAYTWQEEGTRVRILMSRTAWRLGYSF